jgi:hypothetical protein
VRRFALGLFVVVPTFLAGCGDDAASTPALNAVPGAAVLMDLEAARAAPETFYDYPLPSDLRVDDQGRPSLEHFPKSPLATGVAPLLAAADRARVGWSVLNAGYFRFDAEVAPSDATVPVPAARDATVWLIDVDPGSPERGAQLPVHVGTLAVDDYAPERLLGVVPAPGVTMHPARRYAYVVKRSYGDAQGAPLGVPLGLVELRRGRSTDPAATASFALLWETLDAIGVARDEVAAATVFITDDVVRETHALGQVVLADHDLRIEGIAIDADDGAAHERYCELHGFASVPQFQQGVPPFDTEGRFVFDAQGKLVEQRRDRVPVTITLPKGTMPAAGWPLVTYGHGSGGLSTQVVDRGPITVAGGQPAKGLGPAHVLAARGFATFAAAHPLNPERLPGAEPRAYLNFDNLGCYGDNFRQGHLEERLFIEALGALEIDPSSLAACTGVSLPAGATQHRFDTREIFAMGQSMGAQYVTLLGATEPLVRSVIPTGSGGHWTSLVTEGTAVGGSGTIGLLLATREKLTLVHPALMLMQLAWEAAEPVAYAPHIARRPLEGQPSRDIYTPVGFEDTDFAEETFDALAIAYGTQQLGDQIWPTMQPTLALVGREGLASYPLKENRSSESGAPFTAGVVQFRGDGISNPHTIFTQLEAVMYQYGCFFTTRRDSGRAMLLAPGPVDRPCTP